tara:strand:- start:1958 stop:2083 length:126 start_codon:yes stop_codon:yes gene_type:complete
MDKFIEEILPDKLEKTVVQGQSKRFKNIFLPPSENDEAVNT